MEKIKKYLLVMFILILITSALAVSYMKSSKLKTVTPDTIGTRKNLTSTVQQKDLLNIVQTNFAQPTNGKTRYENFTYGFGFDYPSDKVMNICPSAHCGSVGDLELHFDMISFSTLYPRGEPLTSRLLRDDLYCTADGMGGSIWCDPDKKEVENIILPNGTKAYKLYRVKYFKEYDFKGGSSERHYDDEVYIIPLPERINGEDAIFLYAEEPTAVNVRILEQIAKSLYFKPTW
ncbi:MAG: hypothetical protein E6Q58_03170 [Niabella sp.]|nr:MAG: hypothetical protein E6Q58_03170 [Niabella sp.]